MKYAIFVVSFLVIASLSAEGGPSSRFTEAALVISCREATDVEINTFPETSPFPSQVLKDDMDMDSEPSRYAPLWGPDLLVTNQCVIPPRYGISLDYDANGYIYAGVQSCHNGGTDTLFFYRSTDNGYTWNDLYIITTWVGLGGKLLDFDLKIEPYTTDDPEIYIVWADSEVSAGYRLYFGALRASGTERWFEFTDPEYDSTFQVAMDVEPDSNPFIVFTFISYEPTAGETSWQTAVSSDTGVTWTRYGPHTSSSGPMEVTASCLDANNYYIGTIYTQSSNRFRMARYNGTWNFDNVSTGNDTVRYTPNICTQKYHAYPANYVYGMYTQGSGSRVYYNYSSDGGATWAGPAQWSISGDVYSMNPNMRLGWDMTVDRPAACCFVEGASFDSLVTSLMSSNFYTWDSRIVPNDHPLTTEMPAQINTCMIHNGRFLIYREYSENNIWFDRWDLSNQVEETPNDLPQSYGLNVFRSGDCFRINFSTPMDQKVRIEVFDILGRTVSTVADQIFAAGEHNLEWNMTGRNGENVVAGTYFINFVTDTQKETKSVQVF